VVVAGVGISEFELGLGCWGVKLALYNVCASFIVLPLQANSFHIDLSSVRNL
jgi:hypothetical protein